MPRTRVALLVPLLLLMAACGRGDPDGSSSVTADAGSTDPTFPVQVAADNGEVTIEERPERIVSLAPTATEILFAVGAGDQVVAVDDQSNFPPEAPVTDLSGYTPNIEAVASFEPDLVVLSNDPGDLVPGLEALGVPATLLGPADTLDDTYRQIEVLGVATGHVGEAAEVVASMQAEIDDLVGSVPEREVPLTFYHELDDTFYSATSSTFIGQMYSLAGLENIADAAQTGSGDYPQLSAEYIISADPDVIFLADTKCCGQSAETVAARPGWDRITAVRTGAVYELDDDIASRWGPRVVDFLRAVIDATAPVPAP